MSAEAQAKLDLFIKIILFSFVLLVSASFGENYDEELSSLRRIDQHIKAHEIENIPGTNWLSRRYNSFKKTMENLPVFGPLFKTDYFQPLTSDVAKDLLSDKNASRKITAFYRYGISFIVRVAHDPKLSEEQKVKYIEEAVSILAKSVGEVSDSYVDATPSPSAAETNVGLRILNRVLYVFEFLGRDLYRSFVPLVRSGSGEKLKLAAPGHLPLPIPGTSGRDERTSFVLGQLAGDLKLEVARAMNTLCSTDSCVQKQGLFGFYEQITRLSYAIAGRFSSRLGRIYDSQEITGQQLDDEKRFAASLLVLAAMNEFIRQIGDSEVMEHGPRHSAINYFYLYAYAPTVFFLNPVHLVFFTSVKVMDGLMSGTAWALSGLMLASARKQNSGLEFYRAITGHTMKRLATLGFAGKGLKSQVGEFLNRPGVFERMSACVKKLLTSKK